MLFPDVNHVVRSHGNDCMVFWCMGVNLSSPLLHKRFIFIIFKHECICMHTRECVSLKVRGTGSPRSWSFMWFWASLHGSFASAVCTLDPYFWTLKSVFLLLLWTTLPSPKENVILSLLQMTARNSPRLNSLRKVIQTLSAGPPGTLTAGH